ncbi:MULTISPECIES: LuxR C-terminal-related transcriptional regulator [Streptomyces]|uniref:LuxR C-terminal-related transcriptional regulator n=1 Tax=Streptomyces TaxID=1883 RepID=UPI001587B8ED|nr:response regulator transcription factor [Streptomyces sp. CAI-85]NUV59554.1 response regulator transcription factor [Streptomyces sp. CAI-85]
MSAFRDEHQGNGGRSEARIAVAAVDDHPVVLLGLQAYFAEHTTDIELVHVAPDVDALLAGLHPHSPPGALPMASPAMPSVVLLDLRLRDGNAVDDNVRRLRAAGARVLVFTTEHRPAAVRRALDAGAAGLVLKEDPEGRLVDAIRAVHGGEPYLSSRLAHAIVTDPRGAVRLSGQERRVLELIARGLPHRQVARMLHITEDTVRTYRKRAIEAYAAAGEGLLEDNRQLVWRAVADGHIDLAPAPADDLPDSPGW